MKQRGFFGIGIYQTKNEINVGTLWRSAGIFGASFVYTIGRRYKHQASDPRKTERHTPLFHYQTFDDFEKHLPHDSHIVAVEICDRSEPLASFKHPERAVYLLGAEDYGIPEPILGKCHKFIQLPGTACLNVSTAGSIALYDRIAKA